MPKDSLSRRAPRAGWAGLLVLGLSIGACTKETATRIDVTVEAESALMLQSIEIKTSAHGKAELIQSLPVSGAPRLAILLPDLRVGLDVTVVATGISGAGARVVSQAAEVHVTPGEGVAVVLHLSAACVPVTCNKPGETCSDGTCRPRAHYGKSDAGNIEIGTPDAGADSADARPDLPANLDGGSDGGGSSVDALPDLPPACPAQMHSCPGGCVRDDDPRTCGSSCTPCQPPTNGTATCDGKSCGGTCESTQQLCLGACVDKAASCGMTCPLAATHLCNGLCPSVMDVKACGTACAPCPVPVGASQATCDGTKCDFQCMTTFHKCGTRCASDDDATGCGTACLSCPTDPNGTAQCVGGACNVACRTGYHLCGGRCVANNDVGSCGTSSCTACVKPTGGSTSCDGTNCLGTCPAPMKLCNGTCVASDVACGACPPATHNCADLCVSNTSVDSCGTSCVACAKPTGASTTTCNGTSCDFMCGSGYHRCSARCAADNDPTGCGTSCLACATDPNGSAACVSGACALKCNDGFHVCANKCVSNRSVDTCGPSSCDACPKTTGGNTTCDGLACLQSCTTGKLCLGACIASNLACNGMCDAGTHPCNGVCQPDNSTTFCGPGCNSCTAPASNGSAVCNVARGACEVTCTSNFRNCPNTTLCVPTNGGCCTSADCTAGGANTVGLCSSANTCSYPCDGNSVLCNGSCIPRTACCTNTDCTPVPSNTAPTCSTAHVCSFPCAPNFQKCVGASACTATNDPNLCGPSCIRCPAAPVGGSETCNPTSGACTATCGGSTPKLCAAANLCIPSSGCCLDTDCPTAPANTVQVCGLTTPNVCGNRCVAGAVCTPSGTPDPCKTYAISCASPTATPACTVSGNRTGTVSCGAGAVCTSGVATDAHLCDGAGNCLAATHPCSSTGCNAAGTACNAACAVGALTCGTACCTAGQGCCGGRCTINGVASCGSDCVSCQQPNTAATSCVAGPTVPGVCNNTCLFGALACGDSNSGKPTCNSWDFESNTTEGWFLGPGTTASASISTSTTHSLGLRSLAVTTTTSASATTINIRLHICGGTMALANQGITADVRIETTSGSNAGGGGFVRVYNGATLVQNSGDYTMAQFDPASVGTGFGNAAGTLANNMTDVEFFFLNNTAWSGTIFLDNIRVAPP